MKSRLARRLDPANFHYWRDLGLALLAANRLPEAVACLRKALVQRPAEREVSRHLGECLCSLGEYEAALNVFNAFNAASRSRAGFDMGLRPEIAKLKTWRLEAAWEQKDPALGSVAAEPYNDPLRQFPRFSGLLHKMSLP